MANKTKFGMDSLMPAINKLLFFSIEILWFFCIQPIDADDIADAIVYILSAKPHVQVVRQWISTIMKTEMVKTLTGIKFQIKTCVGNRLPKFA